MRHGLTFSVVLAIISTLFILALAELGLRLWRPIDYRRPDGSGAGVWQNLLHRSSDVPGLAYELVPGMTKKVGRIVHRINSEGMRDTEPRPPDTVGLRRIAAVGDSYMYGFGVRGGQTFANRLERLLNGDPRNRGWVFDVLNLGVGGYATRDEAAVFEHKALPLDPDWVLVGYVLNDPEIEPMQPLHEHFSATRWWQHSSVLRRVHLARRKWRIRSAGGDYFEYLHDPHGKPWHSVLDAFEQIGLQARRTQLPTTLLIFPVAPNGPWSAYRYRHIHRQVAGAAREAGLRVLDLLTAFEAQPPVELRQSEADDHPTGKANRIAARAIHDYLMREPEFVRDGERARAPSESDGG